MVITLLSGCTGCNSDGAGTVPNEGAQATIDQLKEGVEADVEDSVLPDSLVEVKRARITERTEELVKQINDSKFSELTDAEITQQLRRWLDTYKGSCSPTDLDKIRKPMARDQVLKDWRDRNRSEAKALGQELLAMEKECGAKEGGN